MRERLYEAYASQYAGCACSDSAAPVYRRGICPVLLPLADGYSAEGVDIRRQQAALGSRRIRIRHCRAVPVDRSWCQARRASRGLEGDQWRLEDHAAAETGVLRRRVVTQNINFAARRDRPRGSRWSGGEHCRHFGMRWHASGECCGQGLGVRNGVRHSRGH